MNQPDVKLRFETITQLGCHVNQRRFVQDENDEVFYKCRLSEKGISVTGTKNAMK